MKNILVLVHDDCGQEARLQAALDATRALRGHLHCLDVAQMPVVVESFGGASTAILMEDELRREGVNRTQVERQLGGEDVSWSCADTVGDLAACMLDAARTADLVVLNRRLDGAPAPDMPHIVGEVLMKSRALVLVVDDDLRGFDAAGKVLVAWDGSRTVMSTLQRATPLLALAEEVKLFQVGELGGGAIPIEEAAAYLSRHGIRADAQIAPKGPEGAAVAIRMEAERFGAAWCLMGAFKHGRLKEALFGGVARAMLGGCNLPLVMGH